MTEIKMLWETLVMQYTGVSSKEYIALNIGTSAVMTLPSGIVGKLVFTQFKMNVYDTNAVFQLGRLFHVQNLILLFPHNRQRQNWKEERKMNCETFGIAYARNRGRGGYYRGGYYRGGYRGNFQGGRGQGRGRPYRSNRGRGGWRSQQSWNDHSNDTQQSEVTNLIFCSFTNFLFTFFGI